MNASIRLSFASLVLLTLASSACATSVRAESAQHLYRQARVAEQPPVPGVPQSVATLRSQEGSRTSVH